MGICAEYLFDACFYNVDSGWKKGVVEKNMQDCRRRIWNEAQPQRFTSFAELNAWLARRCRALWDALCHLEHAALSAPEMLEQQRSQMARMLRAEPAFAATTMIAHTGFGSRDDRRNTAQAGLVHHLVKQADLDELKQILGRPGASN